MTTARELFADVPAYRPPNAFFSPDIEGLRAIAILLVVAFHLDVPGWTGRVVGVDVFFVASGYLITQLLVQEIDNTGHLRIIDFSARRLHRRLPAASVTLIATILVGSMLVTPVEREILSHTAFAASFYASNIWFQIYVSDYFSAVTRDNPVLHTWSLAVEEQFYLVWPVVLFLAYRMSESKRILVAVTLAFSAASFAGCLWLVKSNPQSALFSSPARAWEFGVGALAVLIPPLFVARVGAAVRFIDVLGLLAILVSATLFNAQTAFSGAMALIPVVGAAAVLVSGLGTNSFVVSWFLQLRILQYLERLSYSWYLWHWPLLVLGVAVLPSLALPGRLVLALVSLGVAAVSYALVENPIRFSHYLTARPMATLGLAVAVTVVVASTSRIAKAGALEAANTPAQLAITESRKPVPPGLSESGCFLNFVDTRLCERAFGDIVSPTTIMLFGDSHAAQWFSAFQAIAHEPRECLIVFTKAACATPSVELPLWTIKQKPYTECTIWRDAAMRRMVERRLAVVVLGNSDNHVTRPNKTGLDRLSLPQWQVGTHKRLEILSAMGIKTVILRDTPGTAFDVLRCLSRADVRNLPTTDCDSVRKTAIREEVFRASTEAAAGLAHVSMLDCTDHFCGTDDCPAVLNGAIVFGDTGHISNRFAHNLAGAIALRIVPLATKASGAA